MAEAASLPGLSTPVRARRRNPLRGNGRHHTEDFSAAVTYLQPRPAPGASLIGSAWGRLRDQRRGDGYALRPRWPPRCNDMRLTAAATSREDCRRPLELRLRQRQSQGYARAVRRTRAGRAWSIPLPHAPTFVRDFTGLLQDAARIPTRVLTPRTHGNVTSACRFSHPFLHTA